MLITAFFTNNGVPEKGLTPAISGWRISDGAKVVDEQAMTEINDDKAWEVFYKYSYSQPDDALYFFVADGGATLSNFDRYKGGEGNGLLENIQVDLDFLKDIEGGRWHLVGDQMIFYKADNITEVARFDLTDINSNPAMTNVYQRTRV
jgi:hypothetical protein